MRQLSKLHSLSASQSDKLCRRCATRHINHSNATQIRARFPLTLRALRGRPFGESKASRSDKPSSGLAIKELPLDDMLREYLPILVFLAVAVGLGIVLILAAAIVAVRNPDPEKVSAYECGFNAFDDARMKFDVRFYLVSILFIIFDLEIAFLFPWAVAFQDISMVAFWSMMVFLAVLTAGFAYEWKKGALEWQ